MKKYILIATLLLSTACARSTFVIVDPPVGPVPAPVPGATIEEDIASIVAHKDAYRLAAGQVPLTKGLTCTLYKNVVNPDLSVAFPSAGAVSFSMLGEINQADSSISVGMNVLPAALRATNQNRYGLRCKGYVVVIESAYHLFKLTSDDGSRLYIDGALLIDNNFNHGSVTLMGSKLLERGLHSIRLDYAQTGGGSQSLILESQDGVIPAMFFYR